MPRLCPGPETVQTESRPSRRAGRRNAQHPLRGPRALRLPSARDPIARSVAPMPVSPLPVILSSGSFGRSSPCGARLLAVRFPAACAQPTGIGTFRRRRGEPGLCGRRERPARQAQRVNEQLGSRSGKARRSSDGAGFSVSRPPLVARRRDRPPLRVIAKEPTAVDIRRCWRISHGPASSSPRCSEKGEPRPSRISCSSVAGHRSGDRIIYAADGRRGGRTARSSSRLAAEESTDYRQASPPAALTLARLWRRSCRRTPSRPAALRPFGQTLSM